MPITIDVTKHPNAHNHLHHYQATQQLNSAHITYFTTSLTNETKDIQRCMLTITALILLEEVVTLLKKL